MGCHKKSLCQCVFKNPCRIKWTHTWASASLPSCDLMLKHTVRLHTCMPIWPRERFSGAPSFLFCHTLAPWQFFLFLWWSSVDISISFYGSRMSVEHIHKTAPSHAHRFNMQVSAEWSMNVHVAGFCRLLISERNPKLASKLNQLQIYKMDVHSSSLI